jgi:hypothetical protein
MAKIKINVKKVVDISGNKKVQLVITGMLHEGELPAEYIEGSPAVWAGYNTDSRVMYRQGGQDVVYMPLSDPHSSGSPAIGLVPEDAKKLIVLIQESGERLHKINQRIAVERAMYAGESEITI